MKKVLFVFAIAAAFAACNNGSEPAAATTDSTKVDSTVATAPVADTTKKDSTAAPVADTTKKVDSAAKH